MSSKRSVLLRINSALYLASNFETPLREKSEEQDYSHMTLSFRSLLLNPSLESIYPVDFLTLNHLFEYRLQINYIKKIFSKRIIAVQV